MHEINSENRTESQSSFYCEIPAPEIAPIDDGIWRVIEDNLTYKQFEAIQFRNQGYTNREIADLCGS